MILPGRGLYQWPRRPLTAERHYPGDGASAIGDHDLLAALGPLEVPTEVISELTDTDFGHDAILRVSESATYGRFKGASPSPDELGGNHDDD